LLAVALLAGGAVLAGLLSRQGMIHDPVASEKTPAEATEPKSTPQLDAGWREQRVLAAPAHDMWAPTPRQQDSARTDAIRESPSAAPAPPQAPPVPYAYVGKGRDARGRFAVLSRDDRIQMVRLADVVEGAYRVESIGEDRVVLTYLALDTRETLLFPGTAGGSDSAAEPLKSAALGEEGATLRVTGPRQAAIGEQFTLMVDLEPGGVGILQDGNVELYYDTKVLRRDVQGAPQAPDSGRVRVDISGSHIGHSAATAVQFRVAASAPTTTEIRIVPLDVADTEGRNVAVTGPDRYRLSVVAAPAK
jgi:hypothetical protein